VTTRPLIGALAGQAASTAAAIEPPGLAGTEDQGAAFRRRRQERGDRRRVRQGRGHGRIEQRAKEGSRLEPVRMHVAILPQPAPFRRGRGTTPRLHRCSLRRGDREGPASQARRPGRRTRAFPVPDLLRLKGLRFGIQARLLAATLAIGLLFVSTSRSTRRDSRVATWSTRASRSGWSPAWPGRASTSTSAT
jgi:hypothetical protein